MKVVTKDQVRQAVDLANWGLLAKKVDFKVTVSGCLVIYTDSADSADLVKDKLEEVTEMDFGNMKSEHFQLHTRIFTNIIVRG